jgi:DNA polymerase-3 subunit beta
VKSDGVDTLEPGAAALPVKRVSELFNKAAADEMILEIKDGQATLTAGKSRYRFTTYPAGDFPTLPSSTAADFFFSAKSDELARALENGSICAYTRDEQPIYLSSVYLDMKSDILNVVSTDKRRIALYRLSVAEHSGDNAAMLPNSGVKEFLKILGASKTAVDVKALKDDAQIYFVTDKAEFSIRMPECKFPNYASKFEGIPYSAKANIDKTNLLAALERVNIVVRDYNRTAEFDLPGGEEFKLYGRAAEFGEATEVLDCSFSGEPVKAGFNSRFLLDGINSCEGPAVTMSFAGAELLNITPAQSDSFMYLVAAVEGDRPDAAGDESARAR